MTHNLLKDLLEIQNLNSEPILYIGWTPCNNIQIEVLYTWPLDSLNSTINYIQNNFFNFNFKYENINTHLDTYRNIHVPRSIGYRGNHYINNVDNNVRQFLFNNATLNLNISSVFHPLFIFISNYFHLIISPFVFFLIAFFSPTSVIRYHADNGNRNTSGNNSGNTTSFDWYSRRSPFASTENIKKHLNSGDEDGDGDGRDWNREYKKFIESMDVIVPLMAKLPLELINLIFNWHTYILYRLAHTSWGLGTMAIRTYLTSYMRSASNNFTGTTLTTRRAGWVIIHERVLTLNWLWRFMENMATNSHLGGAVGFNDWNPENNPRRNRFLIHRERVLGPESRIIEMDTYTQLVMWHESNLHSVNVYDSVFRLGDRSNPLFGGYSDLAAIHEWVTQNVDNYDPQGYFRTRVIPAFLRFYPNNQ